MEGRQVDGAVGVISRNGKYSVNGILFVSCADPYIDATLTQLRAEGYPVRDQDVARLSSLMFEHINLLGRYAFSVPEAVTRGELRPLRNVRLEKPQLPFPKIKSPAAVEKYLTRPQLKVPQHYPLHLRPAEETGEFLAVNVKAKSEGRPSPEECGRLRRILQESGNPEQPGPGLPSDLLCATLLVESVA